EAVSLSSEMMAFKSSKFKNHAIPDALLTPEEVMGEEERRRQGHRRRLQSRSAITQPLDGRHGPAQRRVGQPRRDRQRLRGAPALRQPRDEPDLQAAERLHGKFTLRPRIRRRDEKLNERLIPYYDPTGRLLLWSDDPVPEDKEFALQRRNSSVQLGIVSIDEARAEMGLAGGGTGKTPFGLTALCTRGAAARRTGRSCGSRLSASLLSAHRPARMVVP